MSTSFWLVPEACKKQTSYLMFPNGFTALMTALLKPVYLLLLLSMVASTFADGDQIIWQEVTLAGDKLGYRQVQRKLFDGTVQTTETLVLTLQQPGEDPQRTETVMRYVESLEGQPLALEKHLRSASANHTMSARIEGGRLHIARGTDGSRQHVNQKLPKGFLLREGVRQALLAQKGNERSLTYSNWNFAESKFERYRLRASGLPAEEKYQWRLERESLSAADGRITELFANAAFDILEERSTLGGDTLVLRACDKACALSDFYPVTHVYRSLLRAPVKISEAALRGKVRYVLGGDFDITPPATGEQFVRPTNGGWQIDVCEACGQEATASEAELQQALQSNYWIAADNSEMQARVSNLLGRDIKRAPSSDAVADMKILTRFVEQHMDKQPDYSGYATALEAYTTGKGDCTEHALLLASMARAAGIPARIAVGLAYNNERFMGRKYVFVPHSWVQVWTGERWQSFDSGLGAFHAGYIVLGFSGGELSDTVRINQQLHRIQIVSAVQVLSRD